MVDLLQDPISRVYTVISILMLFVSSVLVINHNLAQEAFLAAKTARPFPYTSQMATSDHNEHMQQHRDDMLREREFLNAKLETITQSFKSIVNSLDIPPPEVKDKLTILDKQIHVLEMEFAILRMRLDSEQNEHDESAK